MAKFTDKFVETSFNSDMILSECSGEKTSSVAISAIPCLFTGIEVITDGTNPATVILYDNATTNSGTKLCEITVVGAENYGGFTPPPTKAHNGIYAAISGTGASCIVFYATMRAKNAQS